MIASLFKWDIPEIRALEETLGEKIAVCKTREEALEALPEADIVVTMGGAGLLDESLLDAAPKLKLVLSLSAGVERLPVAALHARDIIVCNGKGAFSATIAEFVLGGMLALAHNFPTFMRNQLASLWQFGSGSADLEGKELLIVGAGSIGGEIARRAGAFGMTVTGLRRHPEPMAHFDTVIGADGLHAALPRADFVALAVPMTGETKCLFGAPEFTLMKETAFFVNISRGGTVDEAALIEALRHKRIAGAYLDVFATEPLPQSSPLWAMDNVLITPHSSGISDNASKRVYDILSENIRRFRSGAPLINQIKKGSAY